MKKGFTLLFILLFSSLLVAQPHGPGHGRGMGPGKGMRRGTDKLGPDALRFLQMAGIVLTEEQTKKVYDIAIKFVQEEEGIRLEIEKIDYNIRQELIKDNPDRNVLRNLIKSKKDYEAERDYLKMVRDLDIIDVLTPQQRAQLRSGRMR
ncbi:Spy/CpxP family protein refolding chaperone [Brachyspira sp. SAP_772]|uniref:Spy/CpxP family protein refolding chaperone n=1 Tax=Brachyspira sp. SAP_772 TaxID=2608385 RepID=UPI0012F4AA49|nr:periplasmic heavy metal sensor [Brachyspira sp. SAP_772]